MKINDIFHQDNNTSSTAPQTFTGLAELLDIRQFEKSSGVRLQLKFKDSTYGIVASIFLSPQSQSEKARKYAFATIMRMLDSAGLQKDADLRSLVGHQFVISFAKKEDGYYEVTNVEPRLDRDVVPPPPPAVVTPADDDLPF